MSLGKRTVCIPCNLLQSQCTRSTSLDIFNIQITWYRQADPFSWHHQTSLRKTSVCVHSCVRKSQLLLELLYFPSPVSDSLLSGLLLPTKHHPLSRTTCRASLHGYKKERSEKPPPLAPSATGRIPCGRVYFHSHTRLSPQTVALRVSAQQQGLFAHPERCSLRG